MEVGNIISYHDVVTEDIWERTRLAEPTLVIVDFGTVVFNRARWRIPAQSR